MVTHIGYKLIFKNVMTCPGLKSELIVYKSTFSQGVQKLVKGSLVITKGRKCSLYKSEVKLIQGEVHALSSNSLADLWYCRLGKMNENGLEMFKKNLFFDMKDISISHCDHCLVGKQHRTLFASTITRKSEVLEVVHTNVCGPMEIKSFCDFIYFVTFIDILLGSCGIMQ